MTRPTAPRALTMATPAPPSSLTRKLAAVPVLAWGAVIGPATAQTVTFARAQTAILAPGLQALAFHVGGRVESQALGEGSAPCTNLCNPAGPKASPPPRGQGMGVGAHLATPAAKLCCAETNGSAA